MTQILELLAANIEITIAAVIFVLVEVYKKTTDKGYRFIPLVGAVLGIILMGLSKGSFSFETFTVGLISGWAPTGGFETIKNLTNKQEG